MCCLCYHNELYRTNQHFPKFGPRSWGRIKDMLSHLVNTYRGYLPLSSYPPIPPTLHPPVLHPPIIPSFHPPSPILHSHLSIPPSIHPPISHLPPHINNIYRVCQKKKDILNIYVKSQIINNFF